MPGQTAGQKKPIFASQNSIDRGGTMDTSELHKAMAWLGHGLTKEVTTGAPVGSEIRMGTAASLSLDLQAGVGHLLSSPKRVCLFSAECICAKQLGLRRACIAMLLASPCLGTVQNSKSIVSARLCLVISCSSWQVCLLTTSFARHARIPKFRAMERQMSDKP